MEEEIRNIVEEFKSRIACSKRGGSKMLLSNSDDDICKLELLMEVAIYYIDFYD